MTEIAAEWWWPSPEAFDDLTVTDTEEGWELSAPDDSELAEWFSYWNQSEEHHALFQTVFVKSLTDHANFVLDSLEQNGENEILPDGGQSDREQAEVHSAGPQPEHELGGDIQPAQA